MRPERGVLITGASRGIGRALAEYFLQCGDFVFGVSRGEASVSHERYRHISVDVTDEKAVLTLFSELSRDQQRVDVLINNAGIASMNHSLLTPLSTAQRVINVNFLATFLFAREAAKLMRAGKMGRIVNFTTVAAPLSLEGEAIYAASKEAVTKLTQVMAKELGDLGITVNAVGPTPIRTDLIRGVSEEKLERLIRRQAIKRFGEMRDVINVVEFLISPESDFITGQTIYLGGIS